ncbi:uncharacterized protein CTRU02_204424 [Colletotrichum truncatum]|uniref:Uncharacterized protein n=1 Tax=Colletotrichum truncatum TaxID=5467 RepID=A0ACC3ZC32_COLTU
MERIVPYTSPGFEILLRCQNYLMTVNEARERLTELYRTDHSFVNHVDPSGKSYIEVLLTAPWPGSQEDQFCLLLLFMRDFKMKRGTKTSSFLTQCAGWIGEGRHLDLLEALIDLDLRVTEIEIDSRSWPEPSSPNWISEGRTPDPFFIDYIKTLCLNNQGFAEMTPLHEAVLFGSSETFNKEISRSQKNVKNFLGQTPVHLAVCDPSHLKALLQAGHDPDAPDNYGMTPLMYAAAMNEEGSLMILLDSTNKLNASCKRFQRSFMHYAAAHGHWKLILMSLCRIETIFGKKVAEKWAEAATIEFQVSIIGYNDGRDVSLHELLAKCGSPDFTFDDGTCGVQNNCLLHEAKTVADVEAILSSGSKLINHTNTAGQHPLIAAAKRHNPEMVRKLLDAGADVRLRDNKHRTSLDHALKALHRPFFDVVETSLDTVRILLSAGADVSSRDCCRCPCSPQGCLPTSVLPHSVTVINAVFYTIFPIWTAEWLNLVHEYRSADEAKAILLSLLRRRKHEKLGMTHVCCRRQDQRKFLHCDQVRDDEIDGIMEEESEFIELLEREMGEIAEYQYEALLELWVREMKVSFDEVYKKHAERKQKWPSTYGPKVSVTHSFVYII